VDEGSGISRPGDSRAVPPCEQTQEVFPQRREIVDGQEKRDALRRPFIVRGAGRSQTRCGSSVLRIFFSAATSIWRMRSALTPYSAASSCSVMPPVASSFTFR